MSLRLFNYTQREIKMSIQSHSQYTVIETWSYHSEWSRTVPFSVKSEKYLISGEFMEIAAGFFFKQ